MIKTLTYAQFELASTPRIENIWNLKYTDVQYEELKYTIKPRMEKAS